MKDIKDALKTTAAVLAVIFVLNQFRVTRALVYTALSGEQVQ
jgi:hypothetical protein